MVSYFLINTVFDFIPQAPGDQKSSKAFSKVTQISNIMAGETPSTHSDFNNLFGPDGRLDNSTGRIWPGEAVEAQGLEVQEVSCKKELADHRGELEITKAAHEKELLAAIHQGARLQNRIEMLLTEKSSLEEDLAAKEETVRQAITRSEGLEQSCSSLKEQYHRLSNDLLNSKNDTTDGQRKLRIDLQEAQKTNEILKIALTKAEKQAIFYENRMHGLNYALEQSPDRVAADNAMIEAKDSMFSRLEVKAGECYTAYVALEKSSRQDKERTEMEIAALKNSSHKL